MHLAAATNDVSAVSLLLKRGTVQDETSSQNLEAIHIGARYGYVSVVKTLLDGGIPVNVTDRWGHTSLHYASRHGHISTVELLLKRGASTDVKTDAGHTPIDFSSNEDIRERLLQAHASESTDNRDGGIRRWLSHIGLEKYAPNFLSQGYDDLDVIDVDGISDTDLNHIGIQKPGHRKKLKVMAKKIPRDLLRNSDVAEAKSEDEVVDEDGGDNDDDDDDDDDIDEDDEDDEDEDDEDDY